MLAPGQDAGMLQLTIEFLDRCKDRVFDPHISSVVTDEIRDAPKDIQDAIVSRLGEIDPLLIEVSSEAESLAQQFIDQRILPPRRRTDGLHVACAIVAGLELLVSWNYRHIANASKAEAFNAVALLAGWSRGIEIHTPLEVLGWK